MAHSQANPYTLPEKSAAYRQLPETAIDANTGTPVACFHMSVPLGCIQGIDYAVRGTHVDNAACHKRTGFDR